MEPREMK